MNKKGFTLVELILVIVIIGIISAITIPNIMESLDESKKEGAKNVEKLLKENLELYNTDNEVDLWCLDPGCTNTEENPKNINITDLLDKNPDINMGECLLNPSTSGDTGLSIKRISEGKYIYEVRIICSKVFKKEPTTWTNGETNTFDITKKSTVTGVYYETGVQE